MDQTGAVPEAVRAVLAAVTDPIERARLCEVVTAHAQAVQLDSVVEVADAQPGFEDPTGHWIDPAPAEIACALVWTPNAASARLDLAQELAQALPCVLDALREGRIDVGKAREIVSRTHEVDPVDRYHLAARASVYAATHTRGQLRAWLARQIARLDPDAAERRRDRERTRRRVWVHPEPDGMATFGAYLTAEEAMALLEALRVKTASTDGPEYANQADMLVALVTGEQIGAPIPVTVLITDQGPELAGYGPLSAKHAEALCDRADRINLAPPKPSPGYRPGTGLDRWVRTRDRHCRFPGCRRPARFCDLDHVIAWPKGRTTCQNLACVCRYHHRLKTHAGWTVRALDDMTLIWTSPTGRIYLSTLEDP
jgi:hypothetical protein